MKEYQKPMTAVLNFEDNKILMTDPEQGTTSVDENLDYT